MAPAVPGLLSSPAETLSVTDTPVRRCRTLALLVAGALAARLLVIVWTTTIATDASWYLWTAEYYGQGQIARALETDAGIHPLYPILTAVVGVPLGDLVAGGYVVSLVSGALTVLPLFYLVRIFWNERVAVWTCLLFALHPELVLETSEVMTTGLFIFLFVLATALLVCAFRGGHWSYFPLSGLTAALCYLTRPEGIYLVLFFAVGGVIAVFRNGPRGGAADPSDADAPPAWWGWARLATGIAVAGVVMVVLSMPYLFWVHAKRGKWTISHKWSANLLWMAIEDPQSLPKPAGPAPAPTPPAPSSALPAPSSPGPSPPPAEAPPAASKAAHSGEKAAGGPPSESFLRSTGKKLAKVSYWPLIAFFCVGVVVMTRLGIGWKRLCLWALMALVQWAPPLLLFYWVPWRPLSHRYFLPGLVFVLPWAAAGLLWILDHFVDKLRRSYSENAARSGAIVFVTLVVGVLLVKSVGPRRAEEASLLEAGAWLRLHGAAQPMPVVVSREKIAYYGGCEPVSLPSDVNALPATCDRHQAVYVVVDEKSLSKLSVKDSHEVEAAGFLPVASFGGPQRGTWPVWVFRRATGQ